MLDGTARPEPERFIIAARLEAAGERHKYLLVRWRDWPPPALLSVEVPPTPGVSAAVVEETIAYRLGVRCLEGALLGEARTPARMRQGNRGGEGMGWLRAAAVRVEGEPAPDALLEEVLALSFDDALSALTSDVERHVFLEAARLLGDAPSR